jgi:hypothetical protein
LQRPLPALAIGFVRSRHDLLLDTWFSKCSVPAFDGAFYSQEWKEALYPDAMRTESVNLTVVLAIVFGWEGPFDG